MLKRLLFLLPILAISLGSWAASVTITESSGWLESAFVKWQTINDADSFNVYYSGQGITDQQIDEQLIRNYGTYYRADIPGLEAGTYTIKIAPVINGAEGESAVTGSINVKALDRTGFAFSNGRVPGAYKADGTPKSGAVVIYITENTKNKVSLDVTGANANPCVGLETILEGFKKGDDNRPLIVRLVGQVTDMTYMSKGDIVLENSNNASGYITLEGVGDDAVADGWGIRVKNASNIEIRNIGTMNCDSDEGDNIGLQQDNDYIWIHHCDFFYGSPGGDADQSKGDGALDSKRSGFVTISYNHFFDSGKSNLLGNGTEDPKYLTYHHNWYDHSDSRHPRVRSHSVHVYNNYYDGNSKYGIGSTNASSVFIEANYFRHCKYPILTSMQGSDVWDEAVGANDYTDMPTFSKEDGGSIKAFNNYMTEQTRFVAYGDAGFPNSTVDFDAYVVSNRNDSVKSNVVSYKGSNTYNNFDINPAIMYSYTPQSPADAKDSVMKYAGRIMGGDLKWAFNNATDDISYDVDVNLKAALIDYQTEMVSIQGDSSGNGGTIPGDPDNPPVDPSDTTGLSGAEYIHNFTLSGTTSTFYSITGNLSTSKGTVNYGGLTLTQCLKLESSTSIKFTTVKEATLTLVFNDDFTGALKINGTSYNPVAGILTLTIPAGSYEITKGDSTNLFYMSIAYAGSGENPEDPDNPDNPDGGTAAINTEITEVLVYPNPVLNSLNIVSDSWVEKVEIYSLTGILVQRTEANIKTIDMSSLNRGTYLIMVFTEQGLFRQTIIKID